jgi:branched-subunit amino acid permease
MKLSKKGLEKSKIFQRKILTIGLLLVVLSLFILGCASEKTVTVADSATDTDVEDLAEYDDLSDDFDDISFDELDNLELE